ncbi:MAG: hypothetical protein AAGG75_14965 [Bacteroidota bacterium]
MKTSFLIITLLGFTLPLNAQITDSLEYLSQEVSIENYAWDDGAPYRLKSMKYEIMIREDTLLVNLNSTDTHTRSTPKSEVIKSTMKYKAPLEHIGKIHFINEKTKLEPIGEFVYNTKIEIEALRDKELFDIIYDNGTVRNTYHIPIRVYKLSDTLKFKNIVSLLNHHITPENNSIEADCNADQYHEWSGIEINAVFQINLQTPIHMNGSRCQESALQQLISPYLAEQNIKSILGYIIIDEHNNIESIWTEQNNLYRTKQSNKESTVPFYAMKARNLGLMTDQQLNDILSILKSQKWEAGKCGQKGVKSYVDVAFKNKHFKETED